MAELLSRHLIGNYGSVTDLFWRRRLQRTIFMSFSLFSHYPDLRASLGELPVHLLKAREKAL